MGNNPIRPQATEFKVLDVGSELLAKTVALLRGKKGYGCFISDAEAYGILAGEVHEVEHAIHDKKKDEIRAELMDVAISALFAIVSHDINNSPSGTVLEDEGKSTRHPNVVRKD